MKKLLHIIATPRDEESRTLQVSRTFLDTFLENNPEVVVDELNLTTEKLPLLSHQRVDGKYVLLQGKDLFGELKESWEEVVKQIDRFLAADFYVVSTPMWNFGIPYPLKHYIDLIVQPKYLFRYTDNGVEGLAKNKKIVVITSRGGEYVSDSTKSLDHQEPYLRTVFNFVGITDLTFIHAQPMDVGEEIRKKKLKEACDRAKEIASQMSGSIRS